MVIKNMVDIGAHEGESIELYSKVFGILKILSFEPEISKYEILKTKYKNNKNIQIYNYAVGATNTQDNLKIGITGDSTFGEMNHDSRWYKIKKFVLGLSKMHSETQLVNIISLDTFDLDMEKIDLIKIDVEGYELNVLKGMKKKLKSKDVKVIIVEMRFDRMYKDYDRNKIQNFLTENNYKLFKFLRFPFYSFGDAIFIKKS